MTSVNVRSAVVCARSYFRFPQLYKPGQDDAFFNLHLFFRSVFHSVLASLALFFIPYFVLRLASNNSGLDLNDFAFLAFTIFSALVVVVTAQIALDTFYWTVYNHIVIWGSLAFYFLLVVVHYQVIETAQHSLSLY
jgi:phospholipid-translocating ATPase